MNIKLKDFLLDIDEEKVAEFYAQLFCDVEGEYSLREAMELCKNSIYNIQEALKNCCEYNSIGEINTISVQPKSKENKRFLFPIIIPEDNSLEITEPIVDIAMMQYSSINKIPNYLKTRPSYIDYCDVEENNQIKEIVYEPNVLSYPVLLTTLEELKDFIIYIPKTHNDYSSMTAAAIIYNLSLLNPDIEEGEETKKELAKNIKQTAKDNGYDCDNADEILQAIAPSMNSESDNDEFLDKMLTARYNARIGMYERIYCDLAPHVSQLSSL